MTVKDYFIKRGYELKPASEPNHSLAFVPYDEYPTVSKYLRRKETAHNLRFNHDYSTAIFFFKN